MLLGLGILALIAFLTVSYLKAAGNAKRVFDAAALKEAADRAERMRKQSEADFECLRKKVMERLDRG